MIRKLLTYFSLTLLLIAGGCSADDPMSVSKRGDASLTLLIPSTVLSRSTGETRGLYDTRDAGDSEFDHKQDAGDATAEGAIKNNFYVVAFYKDEKDDNKLKYFAEPLTPEMGNSVDGVYRSYSFDVAPATYDIYLVANVPEMASLLSGNPEASTLQTKVVKLTHSYVSSSTLALPDLTSGLPMACELLGKKVADGQPTTLHAPLEFLCAKVRLTVIHDADLGQKGLKVSQLGIENAYSPVNCFAAGAADAYLDGSLSLTSGVGTGNHYALSTELAGKTLAQLAHVPTDGEADILDFSSDSPLSANTLNGSMANVYQNICYVPESPEMDATHPATSLVAKFINANSESKTIKFPLGCTKLPNADRLSGCDRILRGHFYDVVAKFIGGDVFFSWTVVGDWEPENLSIKLAGNTSLWLDRVDIADSSKGEMKVNGETPYRIAYTTSAPRLSFESCKVGNNPVFDIVENKDEGVLEVTLNSSVTTSTTLPADLGFMVIAGNVRKWVRVKDINAEKFFRISPHNRYLYISQIINESTYALVYEYATNMDDFTLELADYVNTNESKGKANINIAVYTGTYTGTLEGLEQYTEEVSMTAFDTDNKRNLKSIDVLSSRSSEEWPKSGVVVITIKDPSNQKAFGKKITGAIKGKGTEGSVTKPDQGLFEINPAPQKYTIHFREINGNWDNPHIYVYQPLTFTDKSGNEYDVYDGNKAINWLEYSFTGKMVFKGWKAENGEVDDPTGNPQSFNHPKTQNPVTAYVMNWAANAGEASSFTTDQYFMDIDLISAHRNLVTCNKCKDANYKKLWPGVSMVYEGGANNSGWWKIELPLLAEPGKAMMMFVNNHDHDGSNTGGRWPFDGVPGIPLPNFASREAWFLYDATKRELCDFSDYPRTAYNGTQENPYSGVYVNVQGEFNNWADNGASIDNKGQSLHTNLAIGNKRFQICVYDPKDNADNHKRYYSAGTNINQNQWTSIPGNGSNMHINNANENDKFDIYFNIESKLIKVIKK